MVKSLSPPLHAIHNILFYTPHILVILSIVSWIVVSYVNSDYSLKSLIIFIPLIVTSIILILNKQLSYSSSQYTHILDKKLFTIFILALLFTQVILSFTIGYSHPVFLIVTSITYIFIFLQSISKGTNATLVLCEIILATAVMIFAQLFGVALWMGDTDLISHYEWASSIVSSGFLPSNVMGAYATFCLYHILIALTSLLCGLASDASLYIISTIAIVGSIPFVYWIALSLFKSQSISLLSALFYALMPVLSSAYLMPAPRAMASVAFIIVLYILVRLYPKHRISSLIVLVIVSCYIALVHHAQLLYIILVSSLLIFGGLLYFYRRFLKSFLPIIICAGISLISLLIGYGGAVKSILQTRLFNQLDNILLPSAPVTPAPVPSAPVPPSSSYLSGDTMAGDISGALSEVITSQDLVALFSSFISMLPVIIMMVFCLVGIYYAVTSTTIHIRRYSFLIPLLLILFMFFVNGVVDLFPLFTDSFQIYRLRILIAPLFAIIMAVGCLVLFNISKTRKGLSSISSILTIILSVLFIVGSVSSYGLNSNDGGLDDILPSSSYDLQYFHEWDISLMNNIPQIIPENQNIYSATRITSYMSRVDSVRGLYPYEISSGRPISDLFTTKNATINVENYVIFPHSEYLDDGINMPYKVKNNELVLNIVKEDDGFSKGIFERNNYSYNIVYNSWMNLIYYKGGM